MQSQSGVPETLLEFGPSVRTIEMPSYASMENLQIVIDSAKLAILNEDPVINTTLPPLTSLVTNTGSVAVVTCAEVRGTAVLQLRSVGQWHPSVCGHHAYFNALSVIAALNGSDLSPLLNEQSFWKSTLNNIHTMQTHSIQNNLWKSNNLNGGILDGSHLNWLISQLPANIKHNVRACETVEEVKHFVKNAPIDQNCAIIFGAQTHWITFVLCTINGSRYVIYMDSHNKPINDSVDVRTVADEIIEKHREVFIERLKRVPRWQMAPNQVLSDMFTKGIPEYWKGFEKNQMWWSSRPASIRKKLLIDEVEASRNALRTLCDWFQNPQGFKECVEETELSLLPRAHVDMEPSKNVAALEVGVATELTSTHFRGYVRHEQNLPEDCPEYKAGNRIENRKAPPLPQIPEDAFDRQRVITGFDQMLVERQVCLVLGTGGLGQDCAIALARMGVDKIIFVDFEIYEPSNLTRQCLGGLNDMNKPKVNVAKQNLEFHNLRSQIHTFHTDVVRHWKDVVSVAQKYRVTVLFNCVDVGVLFDFAVNSLSKRLRIPLVSGQSFAWKFMVEYYSGTPGKVCAFCQESTLRAFGANAHEIENQHGIRNRFVKWLTVAYPNVTEMSAEIVAQFLEQDTDFRCEGVLELVRQCLMDAFGSSCPPVQTVLAGLLPLLTAFHDRTIELLLPNRILELDSLSIVPRTRQTPTRFIGSWVCPCLECGVMMVSQWANALTGPTDRNPPAMVTFNLDQGTTAEEQMAYELASMGIAIDTNDRVFAGTPSVPTCRVCSSCAFSEAEEVLFFGSSTIYLKPSKGEVMSFEPMTIGEWNLPESQETIAQLKSLALSRSKTLSHLGIEYSNTVVPAPPAFDPLLTNTEIEILFPYLPKELGTLPLVKVTAAEASRFPSSITGFASGRRSALVRVNGRWYRLKGCGDETNGFPVQNVGDNGESNVRGCLFEHTALREWCMSDKVNQAFQLCDSRFVPANTAVGWYRYESQPDWPLPLITRYCGVFETVGDRRLGDHLLIGLEKLIAIMFSKMSVEQLTNMQKRINQSRKFDGDELWETATIVECGMSVAKDLIDLELPEFQVPIFADLEKLGVSMNPQLALLWNHTRETLKSSTVREHSQQNPFLSLARRLGWECGSILKVLQSSGISWGTYPDKLGIHCNAHVNNLVVKPLPIGDPNKPVTLLAPLDFDMAFDKQSFIPEAVENSAQKMFPRNWDGLMEWERLMCFRPSLAGSTFASTGVANVANQPHSPLTIAFRDCLVAGFDSAFECSDSVSLEETHVSDAMVCLVRLGLCLTSDVIA
eukprot:c2519_g1_i1.p1 GENE.c2519_g1_i1~~c2519_g1_i1.p1  ORF type:complete len:1392 (+),score=412.82 c2519_g1_i1:290-4177(+)